MSATSASIRDLGVAALGRGLGAGTFSSEEVARDLLAAIAAQDRYGAFLATHAEQTLAQARRADAVRAAGQAC